MNQPTKEPQKTLFVGNPRICQQIAYVLDIQDYALAEKLTKQNFDQFRDHQIYVCEFKRKSRGLVGREVLRAVDTKLQYFDDICRKIDEEYYANRQRHKNALQSTTKAVAVPTTTTAVKTVKVKVQATVVPDIKLEPKPSLLSRVRRGMKHPLRAAWHVVLRTKETIRRQYVAAKQRSKMNWKCNVLGKQPKKVSAEYIRCFWEKLKPSQLLLCVLKAPIDPNIQCTRLETNLQITESGKVKGCCSAIVPFGNLLHDGELDEIYHSTYARIVKLSSFNRSYCFCNLNTWCKGYCANHAIEPAEQLKEIAYPRFITLSFDHSCNLCCKSCRTKPYVMDERAKQSAATITTKLLRSGYLEQTEKLVVAGMGEVFYSPYYRQLLTTDLQRQQISIKSNGILFNESNWRLVVGKYKTINVEISVDAATAETYQKLRGASFETLMKNLTMLGDLRRRKQIHHFGLCFVVQRENFREMPAFVHLGKALGADCINFQRLNNLGSFTAKKLQEQCLIVDNNYLDYELWCLLQDPIFGDPIVILDSLQRYIDASECRYRRRYEREQRQAQSV